MAILKFINRKDEKSKQKLKAVDGILKYVTDEGKTSIEEELPKELADEVEPLKPLESIASSANIDYIMNMDKTKRQLVSSFNCSPETAYEEMCFTKKMFNKEGGRQYIHFVQAFPPGEKVTPETVHEIALKLLEHEKFKGFQVVAATHINEAHLHTHFVLNTVNIETGLKWQLPPKELDMLKAYSDKLCKEYGLSVIPRDIKHQEWSPDGVYRNKLRGSSWRHELYLAASTCLRASKSKEEFITLMNRLGYKVNWSDTRKYVTFTTPEGHKCRNSKLGEGFSKENMLKTFKENVRKDHQREVNEKRDLVLETINFIAGRQRLQANMQGKEGLYPFSRMEGQALREKLVEMEKGEGFDWDKQQER